MSDAYKILQVSNRVPFPLNEGGTIGIYNYTRGFSEAGCEVTLLALDAKKHRTDIDIAKAELGKYALVEIVVIDTDVKPLAAFLNLFSKRSYNVERFRSSVFAGLIEKYLNQTTFDLIQIEGTFPALYSGIILKYRGNAKVVLRQHNVEYQIWDRLARHSTNPLKKWYFNLLSQRLRRFEQGHLNQYDALIPVTPDDGDLFRQLGCTIPIFPSPAGIDTLLWEPNEHGEDIQSIYHIGSLEWMPNVEGLLWFIDEIWPVILKQSPSVKLFVAGKGMPSFIREKHVQNVTMIGEVDSAPEFIRDKGITIVPLKSGSGIRLKILEAMSAGKVVLCTTIGAQGIDYIDGRHLHIANTAEEFASRINQVLHHPDQTKKLKQEARLLIENQYSNKSVVSRLLEFYKEL